MLANPTSHVSISGDIVFGSIGLGALTGILPPLAAGLTVVWVALQIYTWFINKGWKRKDG